MSTIKREKKTKKQNKTKQERRNKSYGIENFLF